MKSFSAKTGIRRRWLGFALVAGLWTGVAGLSLCGEEAPDHGHGPEEFAKLLKYPDGTKLHQEYRKPEVADVPIDEGVVDAPRMMAAAADTPRIRQTGLKLRQRTVVRLADEGEPGAAAAPAAADARDQLASFQFDVGIEAADQPAAERGQPFIPIAKAGQTFVVVNGKAVVVRDRNLPTDTFKIPAVKPVVPFEKARDLALARVREVVKKLYPKANLVLATDTHESEKPELQVYLTGERKEGRLAWRFSITSTNPAAPFLRRFWVAADKEEAEPLDFEDRIYLSFGCRDFGCGERAARLDADPSRPPASPLLDPFRLQTRALAPALTTLVMADQPPAAAVGTRGKVTGTIWKESPHVGGTQKVSLAGITVVVTKGAQQVSVQTNSAGQYAVPQLSGNVKVSATLAGPQCRIVNATSPSATVLTRTKLGAGQIDLDFTEAGNPEAALAQVSAFHGTNTAFAFARPFLPANPTFLSNMRTTVMIDDTCNAFYSPANHSTNYFRTQPGGCANTAYLDVVAHEYGHAVDDQLGGIMDGGYSEGTGDMLCLLLTRQPAVGRDFRKPPMGGMRFHLRDATQAPLWPDVQNLGVHSKGWAYSGFCWKLITNLRAKFNDDATAFAVAKRLLLGAAANNPSSVPDAVRLSFFIDAQVFPGPTGQMSRHFQELKAAATAQQIPIPVNPADLTVAR